MDEDLSELWNKFSLTEEERYEIVITDQDIENNMGRGKLCLVGRVIADKKINKEAFKNTMLKVWKACAGTKIIEVGDNLYVFEFQTKGDLNRIWGGQPWLFDTNLVCLKNFDGVTPPSELNFNSTTMWVQLHNLPLGYMNKEIGGRIGSTIGRVIEVEADFDGNCWGKWIRVQIEMDLMKPLIRGKFVELLGQKSFIQFKYERLPRFCFKCGAIKHGVHGCVGMLANQEEKKDDNMQQYGSWLRASSSTVASSYGSSSAPIFPTVPKQGNCNKMEILTQKEFQSIEVDPSRD
ncbi:uncharacterized protein LOC121238174 [Juglans microcarpa x Juglans regia]|uniref:uncharacterized protein LOC121238174 n=1 Tax=Juglans microcarpa x Juglans regia TaxID=2249226 RepID=UPI001B7DB3A7|nr:uncharacterized protein LOC121238174 [Juglans microcarpa x Juglans regia]